MRVDELSGEALRVAVAEKVLGLVNEGGPGGWVDKDGHAAGFYGMLPRYESGLPFAFEVVEAMRRRGFDFRADVSYHEADEWYAEFSQVPGAGVFGDDKPTLPEAICRAALLAVEAKPEQSPTNA